MLTICDVIQVIMNSQVISTCFDNLFNLWPLTSFDNLFLEICLTRLFIILMFLYYFLTTPDIKLFSQYVLLIDHFAIYFFITISKQYQICTKKTDRNTKNRTENRRRCDSTDLVTETIKIWLWNNGK